ncbi:MAG: thymidylate synthase [Candidatus Babeliaceae bacterium]|jgi:thymidylate synthase
MNNAKNNDFFRACLLLSLLLLFYNTVAIYNKILLSESINIVSDNVDELIIKAIKNITENGTYIQDNPKPCQQAYSVHYTLLNPLNRVHNLRNPVSKKYLCKELLAFFKGSLNVHDGLAQASSVWAGIANENDEIVSNYGYYVFHEKIPGTHNMTQYDWVIYHLSHNLDSRKALININQPYHKKLHVKDYPCTIGIQFFVQDDYLCCVVSSRSTDVYWGLPYNMGFFSFLTELVYVDLKERLDSEKAKKLKLGYVTMKTHFTQIYTRTRPQALQLFEHYKDYQGKYFTDMPRIDDAQETLRDIYNGTHNTTIMQWIYKNAQ